MLFDEHIQLKVSLLFYIIYYRFGYTFTKFDIIYLLQKSHKYKKIYNNK